MPFPADVQTVGGPPRDLNTPFVIDPDKSAFVAYSVQLSVVAPLLSTQSVTVALTITPPDGDPTPIASETLSSTQGGGLSLLSLGVTNTVKLVGFVPAGYTVNLVTSGAGTATYVIGTETY